MRIRNMLVVILGTSCPIANAQTAPEPPTDQETNEFSTICSREVEGAYFSAMRANAIAVRDRLCEQNLEPAAVFESLAEFVEQERLQRRFSEFGGFVNVDSGATRDDPFEAAWARIRYGPEPAVPTVALGGTEDAIVVIVDGSEAFRVADESRCDAEAQARVAVASPPVEGDCFGAVQELVDIYAAAQSAFASPLARDFVNAVREVDADWDRYLDEMRGQTPLELAINTWAYRRKNESETAGFTPAPDRQWIVLHPGLVIENVSDAIDGENLKEALMLELVGVNWWRTPVDEQGRERTRFAPSGFSLISVYSDRPGVTDIGYGLALHFDSVYTIGFTSHDEDNGIFVSFDLLKLLQDKQQALEKYRRR